MPSNARFYLIFAAPLRHHPKRRSICRRSRLVGRPEPFSRAKKLLNAMAPRLFELLGRREVSTKLRHEFRRNPGARSRLHSQRAHHEAVLEFHHVTRTHLPRRFGGLPVELDAARTARVRRQGARLEKPHRPQPLVEAGTIRAGRGHAGAVMAPDKLTFSSPDRTRRAATR